MSQKELKLGKFTGEGILIYVDMVCPQVVDGTDDLQIWRMEGICEYIE
jgi:hypothetical protein